MVTTRAKFKKTQSTSTTPVCSNDDLLIEILCRLPAKSILRFKSVSKHWKSLLSNRYFTLLFDKLSISPGLFYRDLYLPFEVENQSTKPFHSLDFFPDPSGIKIVQSCNGLLLCCSDNGSSRTGKYYVFNPTTKQFKVIPPIKRGQDICTSFRFMGLAFHQTECVHYKVVSLYRANLVPNPDKELYHIQIYSSDTGKWRISHQYFPLSIHMVFYEYGVYWNGAIHWANGRNIFFFKLELEQLQNLALPNYYEHGTMRPYFTPLYFGESQGHMHLVQTADRENRLHLNVYEILSDHSRLFLKYHVELDELPVAYPEMIYSYLNQPISHYEFKILDVVRGVKEEETFMVLRIPRKIIKYNILDKSFKLIFDLSERISDWAKGHRYVESIGSF